MSYVLDSSALLAWLRLERGWERTEQALQAESYIHAFNWAEVLSKLAEWGSDPQLAAQQLTERGVLHQRLKLDLGLEEDALKAAQLRPLTRAAGLSLGDRFCLALGQRLGATVLTADQTWTALSVGVAVECIR